MYKIYINEHLLILTTTTEAKKWANDGQMFAPWMGGKKQLLNYIDKLEKANERQEIAITYPDLELLKKDFWSLFKRVKAAGGVIVNEAAEILFIKRFGHWDLPKGKRDKGEKNKETALREVEEEVGLKCQIIRKLKPTYHTYRLADGRRVLKKTTWYEMKEVLGEVKIQEEEHITDYEWMKTQEFLGGAYPTYASIFDLVKTYSVK